MIITEAVSVFLNEEAVKTLLPLYIQVWLPLFSVMAAGFPTSVRTSAMAIPFLTLFADSSNGWLDCLPPV